MAHIHSTFTIFIIPNLGNPLPYRANVPFSFSGFRDIRIFVSLFFSLSLDACHYISGVTSFIWSFEPWSQTRMGSVLPFFAASSLQCLVFMDVIS